jgi:hypothetical protein
MHHKRATNGHYLLLYSTQFDNIGTHILQEIIYSNKSEKKEVAQVPSTSDVDEKSSPGFCRAHHG